MNQIDKSITAGLEIENLTPDEQQEILLRVGGIIYQNVLMRVLEMKMIADEDLYKFEQLIDNAKHPEEIFSFLKEKVKDFEKIIEEEATKFKDKTANIMEQIGN